MAQVQANQEADLKGVAESKRQQALAIAQQMAGHIQRGDTASATAAAAQLGALNREIQSIGGQQVPIPGASAPTASAPIAPAASAPQTGTLADYIHLPVPAEPGAPGGPPPKPSFVAQHFMDAFNTIQNAKRDIGSRVAGGIDVAYSALPVAAGAATQAIATPFVGPARAEQMGTQLSQFIGQPVGKALGITGEKSYQQPVGPIPGQIVDAIKDFAVKQGLTAEQISAKTGIPPESVRNIATMASFAIPEVVGMAAKPLVTAAREAMPTVVDAKGNVISRPSQPRPPSSTTMQQVQAQFEKKQAAERPADFGAAYTAATEPPLFKPPVQLTPDETGVYRDASGAQIPRVEVSAGFPPESAAPVAAEAAPASVGAAGVPPAMALRGSVDAALANASPELQQFVGSKDINSIHLPSLETRSLEEKHGVNLTVGQRLGDTQQYSSEWNRRGETPTLGQHFNEQPAQVANAFDVAKEKHAPDISATADASELGQHEINALAAKDQVRREAISNAYKALQDANGGQFPIDINTLKGDVESQLTQNLKTNHLSESIKSDLKDFYSNPTFEGFEALRTNLSNEMRSSANGNARAAAYIVRQQLEKMPVFGEEAGSPQAIELKRLADNARSLNAERMNVIASNPAYKAAVGEAANAEGASAQGESLNAAKFHNKYVSSATPESIRRMKSEIPPDDIAHQAIIYGELERAKNAAVRPGGNLAPDSFASFLQKNKSGLNESLSPQAMQDVMELGLLTSKIGMPKTGTFNYSNTYSSILGDMAKQGLTSAGEAKLATMTGGASLPFTSMARQFLLKQSKDKFAEQAVNPYGGLTKD
jgi:desulfoferrodoxin (superoxide reductase-like protein)